MTGLAVISLAGALLVAPSSPRARLTDPHRRGLRVRTVGWAALGVLGVSFVLLPLTTVFAAIVLAATLALRHRRRRRGSCAASESHQLHTAIDVLVGELRVGAHPATAFGVAARESSGPVAEACRAVAARARLGADVAAGLRGVGESTVLQPHWDRLAVCWRLATDHGLAMSALMHAAQRDIAERQRFSDHVRSAMAGARATATILASLPALSVVMGQLIGARPLAFLFGGHLGDWLLVIGLTLVCGGLLWADHITERALA
ncbi:type II secretion system F family protein [Candidatus Mycobacterium wuenschmannii]|uniref:Type II secretion system F family protein n=1 Tax=Candidatus Mycobacterium wuenschmannii TaxID=3027808 RepID=A0ABY8VRY5_9MYCO|nr:type II secretion system F family protein [Candidatus Mycobacterium wuenschmannii]WIM86404.1 type II secretion system F family protein [Candidatus Mycobacterium wuenschmannii]